LEAYRWLGPFFLEGKAIRPLPHFIEMEKNVACSSIFSTSFQQLRPRGRGELDTCHQQDQPHVPTIHIKKLKVSKHE